MTEAISIGPFAFIDSNSMVRQIKQKEVAWGRKDMLKYAIFLNYAALYALIPQENNNKWSFFRSLSIFLQNKNPNQCRILHLNMLKAHNCIENILSYFQSKQLNFLSLCQKFEPIIRNLLHIIARETSKNSKIAHIESNVNMFATVEADIRPEQKDKEQRKATDVAQPQEQEEAIKIDLNRASNQKSFRKSSKCNLLINASEQCHQNFMEYIQKLSIINKQSSDSY